MGGCPGRWSGVDPEGWRAGAARRAERASHPEAHADAAGGARRRVPPHQRLCLRWCVARRGDRRARAGTRRRAAGARSVDSSTPRRDGLTVPRIALRYRLQTDTHGLDLSRHRIISADVEAGSLRPILELDRHGPPAPQVIGALMAAAALPPSGRRVAFRFVDAALARPASSPRASRCAGCSRACPGCGRSRRVRGRRPQRRPATSGAGFRRSGGGPWRFSACARACSSSAMTCRNGSAASCASPIPITEPGARERQSASPSSRTAVELLLGLVDSADARPAG